MGDGEASPGQDTTVLLRAALRVAVADRGTRASHVRPPTRSPHLTRQWFERHFARQSHQRSGRRCGLDLILLEYLFDDCRVNELSSQVTEGFSPLSSMALV